MEQEPKARFVVGQEIFLFGVGRIVGKVVAVTPSGVDVQSDKDYIASFSFDNDGKETEASRCKRLGLAPTPGDPFPLQFGPPEWQPWVIDEASDEERDEISKQFPPGVRKW
jgi:hypothetical protein